MSDSERNKKASKKPISLCIYHGRVPQLPVENGLKSQEVGISSPTVVMCAFHKRELHQQGPVSTRGQGQVMPVLESHNEDLVFVPRAMRNEWRVTACDLRRYGRCVLWKAHSGRSAENTEKRQDGVQEGQLDSYNITGETTVAWPPMVCRQKKGFERVRRQMHGTYGLDVTEKMRALRTSPRHRDNKPGRKRYHHQHWGSEEDQV